MVVELVALPGLEKKPPETLRSLTSGWAKYPPESPSASASSLVASASASANSIIIISYLEHYALVSMIVLALKVPLRQE